jgi:uncharacterized protein involved in response to NO
MTEHQPFQKAYIYTALWMAVFGGFTLGAHIALPMGFGWDLPPFYQIWVQTHGHMQLLGWTGLFIIGVSLYFMPRFLKVPLPYGFLTRWILLLIAGGLVLKTGALFTIPYLEPGMATRWLARLVQLSAGMEWMGVALYLFLLLSMFIQKPRFNDGIRSIQPYLVMMMVGLLAYTTLHFIQFFVNDVTARMPWSSLTIDIFIRLVLFPVAFAFSVRTFPLFMQIPPFRISFAWLGIVYGIFACVSIVGAAMQPMFRIDVVANIFTAVIVLILIYHLKLFPKMFLSPRRFMLRYYGEKYLNDRIDSGAFTKARPGYYDYGQYGRFELLVFSAYLWLAVYAILEIFRGTAILSGFAAPVGNDPMRHIFLLGFITLLIIGMAQRMLPGFARKKGLRFPNLVAVMFVLGNLGTGGRVLPMLLPMDWFTAVPAINEWMMYWFGVSGLLAIAALVLLLINLWKSL